MDRGRLSKGNALPIDALDEAINEAHLEQAHFTLAETPFRTANEAEFYAEPPEQEQPSPPRSLTGEPLDIDRKIQLAFANSAARSFLLQNKQVNNLNQQLARQRDQLGRQNLLIQKLQASLHEATMTKAHSRSQVKPPPSWKPPKADPGILPVPPSTKLVAPQPRPPPQPKPPAAAAASGRGRPMSARPTSAKPPASPRVLSEMPNVGGPAMSGPFFPGKAPAPAGVALMSTIKSPGLEAMEREAAAMTALCAKAGLGDTAESGRNLAGDFSAAGAAPSARPPWNARPKSAIGGRPTSARAVLVDAYTRNEAPRQKSPPGKNHGGPPRVHRKPPEYARLERRARHLLTSHPAAFSGGGTALVPPPRPPSAASRPPSAATTRPPSAAQSARSSSSQRMLMPPSFELSAAERMSETATRNSIKRAVEEGERIMFEAAREASIERSEKSWWNDEPHTWEEFDAVGLEPLLAPDPQFNNEPPIRLLDARFLTKLSERGGWLVPRQSLPEDAFLDLEAVKLLRTHPHAGLRVLCISHIWLQPDHADPRRDTLHVLARALRILLHEQVGTFAVFFDFCSVYQGNGKTASEEALFKKAMAAQGDLFSHPATWTLMVTKLPKAFPRGFAFRPGSRPNVAEYGDRGWPCVELAISRLVKGHTTQVIDLGQLDNACLKYAEKKENGMLEDDETYTSRG